MEKLPDTQELVQLVQDTLSEAVRHPDVARRDSGQVITPALKSAIWEMGFNYSRVYPTRGFYRRSEHDRVGAIRAEALARTRLEAREGYFWGRNKQDKVEEHSTIKEFQYDVGWAQFDAEYSADGTIPNFQRLVLALEIELGGRWEVLYDFQKLLSARAELRAMVWDSRERAFPDGHDEMLARLRDADGGRDGWWLLSGWGENMLEHLVYHDGERVKELEQAPEHARER